MGQFTEEMTRLRGEIDDLRIDRDAFVSNLREDVGLLRAKTAHMTSGIRRNQARMAKGLRGDLGTFTANLRDTVSDLQSSFHDNRAAMAEESRQNLSVFMTGMKEHVTGLRNATALFREGLESDLAGARQGWADQAPVAQRSRRKAAPATRPGQRKKGEVGNTHSHKEYDDLTEIEGIGSKREDVLNGAGICSFADLANSTPKELREALGGSAKLTDAMLQGWINTAKECL